MFFVLEICFSNDYFSEFSMQNIVSRTTQLHTGVLRASVLEK